MTNQNLGNIIQKQINHTINTQPHPTKARITKTHPDGYVDIQTQYGELHHIQTITTHTIGDETILIFLDNTTENKMVI